MSDFSRRHVLRLGAAGLCAALPLDLLACRPSEAASPRVCSSTEANIEGPYYRAGAPLRSDLRDPDINGVPLTIEGHILSADCRSPLEGAELDVWQADASGHYDNDGSIAPVPSHLRLRGRLLSQKGGSFAIRTIVPGRYLNGGTYRPAHIHVKLRAKGHAPLTTQLYFPGDPYNAIDPFIRRSLIMDVTGTSERKRAHFEFVLVPTA